MRPSSFVPPLMLIFVVGALASAIVLAVTTTTPRAPDLVSNSYTDDDFQSTLDRLEGVFTNLRTNEGLEPAPLADPLIIYRRLSLALHGTIPSLEEIREFNNHSAKSSYSVLDLKISEMLADPRFHDYFAERLARAFVGVDEGQLLIFRRDRFVQWLSEQLAANRPYDEMVVDMISETGVWTSRPAANFVTAGVVEDDFDENKLTGRTVRAFLGQRIDCAQCHDHPFAEWKQSDFEGLAAHFGQARLSLRGVVDTETADGIPVEYMVDNVMGTDEGRTVSPKVPFHPEWLPDHGSRRQRLAAWVTHPENRRFRRAIVNRVWGLLFGKPYIAPVDDLPDPPPASEPDVLDILADDFAAHDYDLRRLIQIIVRTSPFQATSTHPAATSDEELARLEDAWVVFPMTRLRPEQVIGAMLQAHSLQTIDQNSHLFVRTLRYFRSADFVDAYGDLGDTELDERAGTISQALLRLNGELAEEMSQAGPFSAAGRIAGIASTDKLALETCFLVCLTRPPTAPEVRQHFLAQLAGTQGDTRAAIVADIFHALFNTTEFSWNH